MDARCLFAFLLAGTLLAGCATRESRYDRYARIAREAEAAVSGRAPAAQAPDGTAAERRRLEEAEQARAAAEKKAREAEKAAAEARKAQARAEAQAMARAEAAEKAAAKAKAAAEASAPVQVVAPATGAGQAASFSEVGTILKPQDVVTVVLRGIPQPEQIEDQIDEEGNISLPFLGEVRAAGYNATDLEREIRRQYIDRKIYQNINVTVIVPSRFYFMQGEIRAPGRYQLVQAIRLSQAIAQAGGYTEFAGKKATITRDGTVFKKVKNTRKLNSRPDDDILLEPGDIVLIERSFW